MVFVAGVLTENMNMKIGPLNDGSFLPVTVNVSISLFEKNDEISISNRIPFIAVASSQQSAMSSRPSRAKCFTGLCS